MNAHVCESCAFALPMKDAGSKDLAQLVKGQLMCRRYPPTLSAFPVAGPQSVAIGQAVGFPLVEAAAWCGEFKPKREDA